MESINCYCEAADQVWSDSENCYKFFFKLFLLFNIQFSYFFINILLKLNSFSTYFCFFSEIIFFATIFKCSYMVRSFTQCNFNRSSCHHFSWSSVKNKDNWKGNVTTQYYRMGNFPNNLISYLYFCDLDKIMKISLE